VGETDFYGLVTDEQQQAWDGFDRLPEPGSNLPFDSFLASRNLDRGALLRLGARLSAPAVLAVAFEGGIKFRNIITGEKFSYFDSTFDHLKIVTNPDGDHTTCIICEGETDAARLTMLYDCDVALMPAGATNWRPNYTQQVRGYARLLVGLDNDAAGEGGFHKIRAALPHARRFAPPKPAGDWCEVVGGGPDLPAVVEGPSSILVPARELLTLDVPAQPSWLDDAILPIDGWAIIHATFKSYKTWITMDLAAALAEGRAWAHFEFARDDPARVAYINFEIPWAYYRARVALFREHSRHPQRFDENFLSYSPLVRPTLVAGSAESEQKIIDDLLAGGVNVCVIDPLRRAIGFANINAEEEIRRMLHFVTRLNANGIAVIMVHHDTKASDRGGGGDPVGMTGSGAIPGDPDTIISVAKPRHVKRDDPRRNLNFTMRNALTPDPRGFQLDERSAVKWIQEPWVESLRPEGVLEV
jgi:hypothetical protein